MVVEMKGYTVMLIKAKLRGILLRNQSPHFLWRLSMGCKHLSIAERHYIQVVRKMGKSLSKIAPELERSPCAISREVKRNTGLRVTAISWRTAWLKNAIKISKNISN